MVRELDLVLYKTYGDLVHLGVGEFEGSELKVVNSEWIECGRGVRKVSISPDYDRSTVVSRGIEPAIEHMNKVLDNVVKEGEKQKLEGLSLALHFLAIHNIEEMIQKVQKSQDQLSHDTLFLPELESNFFVAKRGYPTQYRGIIVEPDKCSKDLLYRMLWPSIGKVKSGVELFAVPNSAEDLIRVPYSYGVEYNVDKRLDSEGFFD